MACFRLLTRPPFPPGPERRVPFFRRRIALSTRLDAAWPYRGPEDFFRVDFREDPDADAFLRLDARLVLAAFRELFLRVDFLAAMDSLLVDSHQ